MIKNKEKFYYSHHSLPGHEIYFDGVEILDRANSIKKLELKEMLYIRKFNPTLNKQLESELFTLIIRNVNSIERNSSTQYPVVLKGIIKIHINKFQKLRIIFQDITKSQAADFNLYSHISKRRELLIYF